VVAGALAIVGGRVAAVGAAQTAVAPGCQPSRPAVAHHADAQVLSQQPPGGPVPCGVYTGFAGSEGKIEVTTTGALMFVPAGTPTDPTTLGTVCRDTAPQIQPPLPVSPPAAFCNPGPQSMVSDGGVAVSHDQGAHWDFVMPMGMTWLNDDNDAWVDHTTGRFFASYITADPPGQTPTDQGKPVPTAAPATASTFALSQLVTSGDDGRSWQYGQACCEITDEGGFTAGPVPPGDHRPGDQLTSAYLHVTYYCWRGSQDVPPQPPSEFCSKSLDAGTNWTPVGFTGRGVVPVHTDVCATPGSLPPSTAFTGGTQPTDEATGMPQAAPDGTLYMVLGCAPDRSSPVRFYLTRSTDEGATWPVVAHLAHPGELRVDTAGNLYLLRAPDDAATKVCATAGTGSCSHSLLLSTSTDGGRTWSAEHNMVAPGIAWFEKEDSALHGQDDDNGGWSCCVNWFYDVREPGHVAVAYTAHTGSLVANGPEDGYITETRDALDADPVFWSAFVNDPARPLKAALGFPPSAGGQQTNTVGLNIGPDGSPWAAFAEDCAPTQNAPACGGRHDRLVGLAGRLAWPGTQGGG